MDSQLKNISESQFEVEITYSYDEVKDDFAKEVEKKIKKIEIPGFRKGKAPSSYIKRIYGDSLEYQASETLANKFFWDFIDSQNIKLVGKPLLLDIDLKIDELFKFTIGYEVLPQIEVKSYTGHEIEVPELTVTEEALTTQIENLKRDYAGFEEDSEIRDNNYKITVDLRKYNEDGLLSDELFQKDMPVSLYNPNVLPEINENSMNKKVSDIFDFTIRDTHHHDHDHDHSHEHELEFKYQATIKKIEKLVITDLSEETIKQLSYNKASNIEEFQKVLKESAEMQNDKMMNDYFFTKLYDKILEENSFTPPLSLVENAFNKLVEDKEKSQKNKKTFVTDEEKESLKKQAASNIRWYLIADAITKKENIDLTEEVIKELAEVNAKKFGISAETLEKHYSSNTEVRERLKTDAFELFLTKNNTMKKVDLETYNKINKEELENEQK
ncbi:MAG: trigger factor [Ignavibacteriaceae bacterium]